MGHRRGGLVDHYDGLRMSIKGNGGRQCHRASKEWCRTYLQDWHGSDGQSTYFNPASAFLAGSGFHMHLHLSFLLQQKQNMFYSQVSLSQLESMYHNPEKHLQNISSP